MNGEKFAILLRSCLLPKLQPFDYNIPCLVVIMDNAIVCYMYIDTGLCNFDHLSHDVPAQQKQEIVQSVPDSSP